ncbi:MAG: hypothetical protein JST04_07850 [Bdellovibrionales bacterium]|nr:hypothetical protein [Bdellovibrionales bacterium]
MMNNHLSKFSFAFIFFFGAAFASSEPTPLKNIYFKADVTTSGPLYNYNYEITNPRTNDSNILFVYLTISRDPNSDQENASGILPQCSGFDRTTSASIHSRTAVVETGSSAPTGWDCSYAILKGNQYGSFGWSASSKTLLKPGNSLRGLVLTSYALPGIREVQIDPDIDIDQLPPEYYENLEKTETLRNNVRWTGKTVGPKAPPKVFDALEFEDYLEYLVEESSDASWIKDAKITKELNAKLEQLEKKIESGDHGSARKILDEFIKRVDALKTKSLTNEAYALLYFNGKYMRDHLPEKGKSCSRHKHVGHSWRWGKRW